MNRDQICLQLYTVRTRATTDFLGTLRAVAEMGYPAVEFAGLHGHTAAEVRASLPAPPSYSAVRAMLRILEDKGHIRHEEDGPRYVYTPIVTREKAKRSALRHVLNTFFDGSASQVVAALFELSPKDLDDQELARLRRLIDAAKNKEGE